MSLMHHLGNEKTDFLALKQVPRSGQSPSRGYKLIWGLGHTIFCVEFFNEKILIMDLGEFQSHI